MLHVFKIYFLLSISTNKKIIIRLQLNNITALTLSDNFIKLTKFSYINILKQLLLITKSNIGNLM